MVKKLNSRKLIEITKYYQERTGQPMNMKEVIFLSISAKPGQPNPELELSVSDSHLFSLRIEPPETSIITDAAWGEYLAYGSEMNLTDDKLEPYYSYIFLEERIF